MSKKERYYNNIKILIKIKKLKYIGDGKINLVADAEETKTQKQSVDSKSDK